MEGQELGKFEQKWLEKTGRVFDWVFEDHPLWGLAIFSALAVTILGGVTVGCKALEEKKPENKNALVNVQKWPGAKNAAVEETIKKFSSGNYTNIDIKEGASCTYVEGKENDIDFGFELDNHAQVKYAMFTKKDGSGIAFDYDVHESFKPAGTIEFYKKNPDGSFAEWRGFHQKNGQWFEYIWNEKVEPRSAEVVADAVIAAAKKLGIDVNAPAFRMATEGHLPSERKSNSSYWLRNVPRGQTFFH